MNIILGTVQFGLNYGITNKKGIVPDLVLKNILSTASKNHINALDTAIGYGNSQRRLGGSDFTDSFSYISKIPISNPDVLESDISKCLTELSVDSLEGILIHDYSLSRVNELKKIWPVIEKYKISGQIKKIGFSLYTPEEYYSLIDEDEIDFDLIQVPLNLLDQRFVEEEICSSYSKNNIEVHVRSIFLQGLLLTSAKDLPEHLSPLKESLVRIHDTCINKRISKMDFIFSFVNSLNCKNITSCVLGATTPEELLEAICSNEKKPLDIDFSKFQQNQNPLIMPTNW